MSDLEKIVGFYRGESADAAGRKITDVWQFDFDQLEKVHDYVQWLFPTAQASAFNKGAPLVDEECARVFAFDAHLRSRLVRSLRLMLRFYGLKLTMRDGPKVEKSAGYERRKDNWQNAAAGYINHNLLRVSRIIDSLRLLGLPEYAGALFLCVEAIHMEEPGKIPAKTVAIWRQMAKSPSAG